jgi:hypothetical protein
MYDRLRRYLFSKALGYLFKMAIDAAPVKKIERSEKNVSLATDLQSNPLLKSLLDTQVYEASQKVFGYTHEWKSDFWKGVLYTVDILQKRIAKLSEPLPDQKPPKKW